MQQQTIAKAASRAGIGLHSGERVSLTIRPAAPGQGVRFVRSDVRDRDNAIPASALAVSTAMLGTNLTNGAGVSVATVEHFLAACAGLGVDNLIAEMDGQEMPILDGTSAPFVSMLEEAGLAAQQTPKRVLKILKVVEVRDGVKFARLSPGEGFSIFATIDFPSKAIGRQEFRFDMTPGAFAREIGWARTFGFVHELQKLRSMGKALGGSLENAVGVDGDAILNPEGLKAPDEFVRHKVLDVVGDLFLAGGPIEGRYEGEQPGHALNNRLLRAVFADTEAFRWMEG
ncbi:MAG TPA: UDP-3-O-acyl-N-acetylglucosamine deacetylase [Hyphomonadaceae bacterium]|jgi:UDP-3-O-[3-hydroxymyristoyl] N-acetylglucosamine deacetylase|nr:UDP-3-O-acyl-N-acetylglucosamine deacetylase [Hyphomonadaceae bacterium]